MNIASARMPNEDTLPWYRQPLVWMVIAIPASAVLVGSFYIYLAATTHDGLVVEDYYKHGLLINDQIERDVYAWEMQLSADVDINPDNGYLRVRLDSGSLPAQPGSIQLALRHATQQRQDNDIVLYKGLDGAYSGTIDREIRRGVWYVELSSDGVGEGTAWRLSHKTRIDEATRLRLLPVAPDSAG